MRQLADLVEVLNKAGQQGCRADHRPGACTGLSKQGEHSLNPILVMVLPTWFSRLHAQQLCMLLDCIIYRTSSIPTWASNGILLDAGS